MDNIVRNLSFEFVLDIVNKIRSVEVISEPKITDALLQSSVSTSMAAAFSCIAVDGSRFHRHLEDGYYASSKVLEYLFLCKALMIPIPDIDDSIAKARSIHKLFASSLRTRIRNEEEEAKKAQEEKEIKEPVGVGISREG